MRRAEADRRGHLLTRVILDTLLPLGVAAIVVALLTDALVHRIDASELRTNTLLMGTRPLRLLTETQEFFVAVASSFLLLGVAVGGAVLVAVPAGMAYAWSTNRVARGLAWSAATFAASLPAFFWAVALELLILALWFRTGWRPLPIAGFGLDEHLVLPALALGLRPAAYIFRLTATAIEDVRHADYVRTAVAKGLRERTLLVRHVLPNAAPAIVAATVFATRGALSSLVIVEFVYVWGGAGLTFVQAIGSRQAALAGALVLAFAVASATLVLAADLVEARVRAKTA